MGHPYFKPHVAEVAANEVLNIAAHNIVSAAETSPSQTLKQVPPKKKFKLDFNEINESALEYVDEIFEALELDGELQGSEYVCINPTRNDGELGSFKFNTATGSWADFADDDASGNGVISYLEYLNGWTPKEAAEVLQKWMDERQQHAKQSSKPKKAKPSDGLTIVQPVPANSPKPQDWFSHRGKPSAVYAYKDASGFLLGNILRFNTDKGKEIFPQTLWQDEAGNMAWALKGFPEPRPLFNLDQLTARPDAPVLVVEGEKAALAAMRLFPEYVVTTVMGGAKAVGKADLTPLKKRDVKIWPDNDPAGQKYATDVLVDLHKQDRTAKVSLMLPLMYLPELDVTGQLKVRTEPLEGGYDAADAIAEGWTTELISKLPEGVFRPIEPAQGELLTASTEPRKGKGKLTIKDHVDNIVAMFGGNLNYINGEFYAYDNGHWPRISEMVAVAQPIAHYLGDDVSKAKVAELLNLVQIFRSISEQAAAPDLNLICLKNGTLDTATGMLLEHSPDHNLRSQINCDWNPTAKCERWLKFMDEIFADDVDKAEKIQLLKEFMGYCLTPDITQQKFLWMLGVGGNGKSVVLEILTALVGAMNVSNAYIERLGDKFVRAELENKLVNISGEMGSDATISDGYLKQIVSGEMLEAERKFKDSFSFKPYVKLIASTNKLPNLRDLSEGFARRAILVQFNQTFDDTNRDDKLVEKLIATELPGILAWAVEGLNSLRKRGRFILPSSSVELLNQYRKESDPERLFVEEALIIDSECAGMKSNDMYPGYVAWCRAFGHKPKAKVNFAKRLAEFGIESKRSAAGNKWLARPNPEMESLWYEAANSWSSPILSYADRNAIAAQNLPPEAVTETPDGYKL